MRQTSTILMLLLFLSWPTAVRGQGVLGEAGRAESASASVTQTLAEVEAASQACLEDPNQDPLLELDRMWRADQLARKAFSNFGGSDLVELKRQLLPRLVQIDNFNRRRLKVLLKDREWFCISEYGTRADQQAWLLVQHADTDPEFQREILLRLERLVLSGETDKKNFAYLSDRVACSYNDPARRVPQTYGTQGTITDGVWIPFPIADPGEVDERRAAVGLGPLSEYTAHMNQKFGRKWFVR